MGENVLYPAPAQFDAPFVVSASGVTIDPDPRLAAAVREAFDRSAGAVFNNVIEPRLLEQFLKLARTAEFEAVATDDFGDRGIDGRARTATPICFSLARQALFTWLEAVTGCAAISTVEGVVARMQPGDILEWHRDAFHGIRRLAIVINLSEQPFEGGRFEMRMRESRQPIFAYDHKVPGSVMIFRLGQDMHHRVSPVTAGGPRVAFAGWLRAPIRPDEPRQLANATAVPAL